MGDRIPQFGENLPRYYPVHSLLLLRTPYSPLPLVVPPLAAAINQ